MAFGHGGGIYISGGGPTFQNLLIAGNLSWGSSSAAAHGAGMYIDDFSTLQVLNATITDNHSLSGVSGVYDAQRTSQAPWPALVNTVLWNNGDMDIGEGLLSEYGVSGSELQGTGNLRATPLFHVIAAGKWSETMEIVSVARGKRIDDESLSLEANACAGKILLFERQGGFVNGPSMTIIQANSSGSIEYPAALYGDPEPGDAYWILDYALDPLSPGIDAGRSTSSSQATEVEGAYEGTTEGSHEGVTDGEPEGQVEGESTQTCEPHDRADYFGNLRGYDGDGLGIGTGDGSDFDMGYLETVEPEHGIVLFPDPGLDAAVRFALNIADEVPITVDLVADPDFISLDASHGDIRDLTGLEYCTYLRELKLDGNSLLENIQALRHLHHIESLTIVGCRVADLSGLSGLTSLTLLDLSSNDIADTSPLDALENLETLSLSGNRIVEIEALRGKFNFETLNLAENFISDFEPIISPSLTGAQIDLRNNPISLNLLCDQVIELEGHGNTVEYWGDCDENSVNFRLDVVTDGGGKVHPFAGTNYYPPDEEVSLTAYSDDSHVVFNYWSGDIGENDPQRQNLYLSMDQDRVVTASFAAAARISIGATEGGGGFARFREFTHAEPLSVPVGSTVELLEAPRDYFSFDYWQITYITDGGNAPPSIPEDWELIEQSINEEGKWRTVAEKSGAPLAVSVHGETLAIPHYKALRRVNLSYEDAQQNPLSLAANIPLSPAPYEGLGHPEDGALYFTDGVEVSIQGAAPLGFNILGFTHGPEGGTSQYTAGETLAFTANENYSVVVRLEENADLVCRQSVLGGENGMPASDYSASIEVVKAPEVGFLQVRIKHNIPDLSSVHWIETARPEVIALLSPANASPVPQQFMAALPVSVFTELGADGHILFKSEAHPEGALKCHMDCGNSLTINRVGEGLVSPFSDDTRAYIEPAQVSIFSPHFNPHMRVGFEGDFDPQTDLSQDGSTLTVQTDQDREITVSLIMQHNLKVVLDGSGSASVVSPSAEALPHDTWVLLDRGELTLLAEPASGHAFRGWTTTYGDSFVAEPAQAETTLDLVGHTTLRATFKPLHEITLAVNGGGSITPSPGAVRRATGDTLEATATPDPGYRFTHWSVSGGLAFSHPLHFLNPATSASVSASGSLTAHFVALETINCKTILDGFTGVSPSESAATGAAKLLQQAGQSNASLEIRHNVASPTTAGIHAVDDGALTVDLGAVTGATLTATLSAAQLASITQEPHYFVLNSTAHANGEIRGLVGNCVDYLVTVLPRDNGSVTLTTPDGSIAEAEGYFGVDKVNGQAPEISVLGVPDAGYILSQWQWNLAPGYTRFWEAESWTLQSDLTVGASFTQPATLRVANSPLGLVRVEVYGANHQLTGLVDGGDTVYAVPPGAQLNAYADALPGGEHYPHGWTGSALAHPATHDDWGVYNITMNGDHTLEPVFEKRHTLIVRGHGATAFWATQDTQSIQLEPVYLQGSHSSGEPRPVLPGVYVGTVWGEDPQVTLGIEGIKPGHTFRRWIAYDETKLYGLEETVQLTLDPWTDIEAEFYYGAACISCSEKVSLEITVEGEGGTSPKPGFYLYTTDDLIFANATPSKSATFEEWQVYERGGEAKTHSSNSLSFLIREDTTAVAKFDQDKFFLKIDAENGFAIPGDSWWNENEEITVTAIANQGYQLSHWILNKDFSNPIPAENAATSHPKITFTINQHTDIEAVFVPGTTPPSVQRDTTTVEPSCNGDSFTVFTSAIGSGDGAVTPSSFSSFCETQSTIVIQAVAYPGSVFTQWISPQVADPFAPIQEVTLTQDIELIANFDTAPQAFAASSVVCEYPLIVEVIGSGYVTAIGGLQEWYPAGTEVTLKAMNIGTVAYWMHPGGSYTCKEREFKITMDEPKAIQVELIDRTAISNLSVSTTFGTTQVKLDEDTGKEFSRKISASSVNIRCTSEAEYEITGAELTPYYTHGSTLLAGNSAIVRAPASVDAATYNMAEPLIATSYHAWQEAFNNSHGSILVTGAERFRISNYQGGGDFIVESGLLAAPGSYRVLPIEECGKIWTCDKYGVSIVPEGHDEVSCFTSEWTSPCDQIKDEAGCSVTITVGDGFNFETSASGCGFDPTKVTLKSDLLGLLTSSIPGVGGVIKALDYVKGTGTYTKANRDHCVSNMHIVNDAETITTLEFSVENPEFNFIDLQTSTEANTKFTKVPNRPYLCEGDYTELGPRSVGKITVSKKDTYTNYAETLGKCDKEEDTLGISAEWSTFLETSTVTKRKFLKDPNCNCAQGDCDGVEREVASTTESNSHFIVTVQGERTFTHDCPPGVCARTVPNITGLIQACVLSDTSPPECFALGE